MYAKAHRRDQKRLKDELLRLHEDQEGFLREEFIWAFCGYPFHISMRTVDCVKIGTL
jgi:hypothetical protein